MTGGYSFLKNGHATRDIKSFVRNKSVRALASSYYWSSTESASNNAWNVNFGSGSTNNNNKYNSNVVRAVAALSEEEKESWIDAYDDCCKHKMSSLQCTLYRLHYEEDLLMLAAEVKTRNYAPSASETFIVKYPKLREIFAANFRDRIAQHWIIIRAEPLLESHFKKQGNVSFNCRKGLGTLAAVKQLDKNIRYITDNWKEDAFVGRYDCKSFFMSIDTLLLRDMLIPFIEDNYRGKDKEVLMWLTEVTVLHEPQNNCIRKGDISLWEVLDRSKSLFGSERNIGMPIGNITSQQFANFYLSSFDEWAVKRCESFCGKYIRFVDDFCVVAKNKSDMQSFAHDASLFLKDKLRIALHKNKVYFQPLRHGVKFVGSVIMPMRTYISNRTVGKMTYMLSCMENTCKNIIANGGTYKNIVSLEHYATSCNSYLGFLVHCNTYAIRRKLFARMKYFWKCCYVEGGFNAVKIRKKYRISNFILEKND